MQRERRRWLGTLVPIEGNRTRTLAMPLDTLLTPPATAFSHERATGYAADEIWKHDLAPLGAPWTLLAADEEEDEDEEDPFADDEDEGGDVDEFEDDDDFLEEDEEEFEEESDFDDDDDL
ncbi:MAG: hypothetical protein KIT19_12115 [Phycisphaeraceae bacterium]|nr:hypothetical protein [Phycisphaeraceae bacterium]